MYVYIYIYIVYIDIDIDIEAQREVRSVYLRIYKHFTACLCPQSGHARGLTMFMLMGLPITVIGYMGTVAGFAGWSAFARSCWGSRCSSLVQESNGFAGVLVSSNPQP